MKGKQLNCKLEKLGVRKRLNKTNILDSFNKNKLKAELKMSSF